MRTPQGLFVDCFNPGIGPFLGTLSPSCLTGADDSEVCGFLASRDLGNVYEADGVGANDFTPALCETIDFRGVGGLPELAFIASTEFKVFRNGARVRVEGIAVEGEMLLVSPVEEFIGAVGCLVGCASASNGRGGCVDWSCWVGYGGGK